MIIGGKERSLFNGVYHDGVIRVEEMDKVFCRCSHPCPKGLTSSTCGFNRRIANHHNDDDWDVTWCSAAPQRV